MFRIWSASDGVRVAVVAVEGSLLMVGAVVEGAIVLVCVELSAT